MKAYLNFFKIWLAKEMTNRINFVMLFFLRLTQFAINLVVWFYIFQSTSMINGYTWEELVSYFFMIMLTSIMFYPSHMFEMQPLVRKGLLNNYLLKPMNFTAFFFTKFGASKFIAFLLCIFMSVSVLIFSTLKIQITCLSFCYLCLNLFMTFSLGMCISCLAFWIVEMWPFRQAFQSSMMLFGYMFTSLLRREVKKN